MSANFNFYVNRQGVQGQRGAKGDQGFSPIISVNSETANEYILQIQNEDGTFLTPNLRGNALANSGGTYVRYDQDTETMYTGEADAATTSQEGVVLLGTYQQLADGNNEFVVPNSMDVHDFVGSSITSALSNYVPLSIYTPKIGELEGDISDLASGKLDKSTFNSYVGETAITLNSLATQKLDAEDLADYLVSGSNVTLSVDESTHKITINANVPPSPQVQADWDESDDSDPSFIKNKPTLGTMAGESASDYTPSSDLATVATTGDYGDLLNKPSIPAAQVQSDWNQADNSAVDYIKNKPAIPAAQIQSDWTQSNTSSADYIKNKPTIPAAANDATITITQGGVVKGSFSTNQGSNATISLDAGSSVTVDSDLSTSSINPVQNKVITNALGEKQNSFIANLPLEFKQEIVSPAVSPTPSASYYSYVGNSSPYYGYMDCRIDSKSENVVAGSEFNSINAIPFEFDKVYYITGISDWGSASNYGRYYGIMPWHRFAKYNETLDKFVPVGGISQNGADSITVKEIDHDATGEVVVNSVSNVTNAGISGTSSDMSHSRGVLIQKKRTSTGIKLNVHWVFQNGASPYNTFKFFKSITDADTPDQQNAFTEFMQRCTHIMGLALKGSSTTSTNSNSTLIYSDPSSVSPILQIGYYDYDGDLSEVESLSELGEIQYYTVGTPEVLGDYGLNAKYDNNTIKLNANNELCVDSTTLGFATINDSTASSTTTYSSNKIETIVGDIETILNDINSGNGGQS